MSVQTAQKFLEMLNSNRGLQTQLVVADPRNLEKLLTFAQGKGFVFSADDLDAALNDAPSTAVINSIRDRVKVRA
jgi:predicted ribosomally synthesized peptide with nif11-like leader